MPNAWNNPSSAFCSRIVTSLPTTRSNVMSMRPSELWRSSSIHLAPCPLSSALTIESSRYRSNPAANSIIPDFGELTYPFKGAHITVSLMDASSVVQNTQDLRDNPHGGTDHPMPGQDLTNAFQALALSKTQTQVQSAPHGGSAPGPTSPYSPVGIQVSPFTMWPILCQPQFQPGMAYVFNGGHHLSVPPATPSPTSHSVVGSLFPHSQRGISLMGATATDARPEPRRLNAARVSRSPYYNVASHHNHVDVNRIREGTDVRTTVSESNKAYITC